MLPTRRTPASLALAVLLGSGCGGEEGAGLVKTEIVAVAVEARVSPSVAAAGAAINVDCKVRYSDGTTKTIAPPDIEVTVAPADGVALKGAILTASKAGSYEIGCVLAGATATPATLEIRAAEPVRSIATLDRDTIASGESTAAHCRVEDANGNEVFGVETALGADPLSGLTIDGLTITGGRAGDYLITCSSPTASLERVPAALTVVPGEAVRIEAQVSTFVTPAGAPVGVTCFVADAAGNEVLLAETDFTVTPAPAMIDELGFTATSVGPHAVVCSLPGTGLSSAPVTVTVSAGFPAVLQITDVVPAKPAYVRRDVVEVQVVMFDAFGNETATPTWEITPVPVDAAAFAGLHRVSLDADGAVTLIATVTSQTEGGAVVSDSRVLVVDGTPPEVVFETPLRAEMVQGAEGAAITVRGEVVEMGSGVDRLEVNGLDVPVDAMGRFETTLPTAWGINLIQGTASDVAGNTKGFVQSFEYAASYRRASPTRTVSGRISSGLVVHMEQSVLDDNSADVDDLATIARLAIQQADIEALIPDPVTTFNSDCSVLFVTITGALRLWVDDVTFGTPAIDITAINGGLHLRATIPNLSVDMHTSGDVCDIGVGISGNASVTRAVIEGNLTVSRSGSNITVSMPSATVTLTGLNIDLDLPGIIDWAVDGIISLFTGAIRDRLEDALEDVIRDQVPPVVDGFLSSIAIGTGFNLPAPLSVQLNIGSVLGSLAFRPGSGDLGFDTTIYAQGVLTPEPRGGILQFSRTDASFSGRPLGAALAFDLINQALYSAWYGGALDLDLTDFIPAALPGTNQMLDVTATANALLPPVIKPSNDPQYPLELQIGDLEIAVRLDGVPNVPPIDLTIYASATALASASVSPANEIELALAPAPVIALELMGSVDGIADPATISAQLEQTLEQILPLMFNEAIRGIPIPTFDLSSMAGGFLPPGIVLGIGNVQTSVQASYLVVEGNVVAMP